MKIAYLVNRYPAPSHSFIRREIRGVEAAGGDVRRFSLQPPPAALPDADDRAEAAITTLVLGQGLAALLGASLWMLLARPGRTIGALRLALRSGGRHLAYLAEAAWLARHLDGAEHLHAHFGTNPAAVARYVHRLTGVPYSITVHGPDEFDAPVALDLRGKIAESAQAVAISSYGRSQLMRWSDPADWGRIAVVRCGVDRRFLEGAPAPIPAAPALCCVARLSAQKGLPLLIEAAARLAADGVDFTLRIVGDGELRPTIEGEIARHGIGDRVILAGLQDAAGVRRHLEQARAFVLPSFAEGLPVVIMEALALGRPVIATAIAGTPELVDEACGWLIPAGSVERLAEAMGAALAADPARLTEMGRIGRSRVADRHDADRNAAGLLALWRGGAAPARESV